MSSGDSTEIWTCPNCSEEIEPQFDQCWKCGADREGKVAGDMPEDANAQGSDKSLPVNAKTDSVRGAGGVSGCAWALFAILVLGLICGVQFFRTERAAGFRITGFPLMIVAGALLGLVVVDSI